AESALPKGLDLLLQLDELDLAVRSPIRGAKEDQHEPVRSLETLERSKPALLVACLEERQRLAPTRAGVERDGRLGQNRHSRQHHEGDKHEILLRTAGNTSHSPPRTGRAHESITLVLPFPRARPPIGPGPTGRGPRRPAARRAPPGEGRAD